MSRSTEVGRLAGQCRDIQCLRYIVRTSLPPLFVRVTNRGERPILRIEIRSRNHSRVIADADRPGPRAADSQLQVRHQDRALNWHSSLDDFQPKWRPWVAMDPHRGLGTIQT